MKTTPCARPQRHLRHSSRRPLLEPLEVRTLLSAAIQLVGNGIPINSGENTPSITDFTDFGYMSTTPSADIGTVTRTYFLTNVGDQDLNLIGSSLVTVSGADAADFTVTLSPDALLTVGSQTSFTVTFAPSAAGARHATLSLASDDPSSPFTFDVQGFGLDTTTDTTNGLQVATTITGDGLGAISGTHLTVHYTGLLEDGTIFDSNQGSDPYPVNLGANHVIQGWEKGLLGIKAGEQRILIIPSPLAYGSDGSSSGAVPIPPNSPLIFIVDALTLDQPTAVVSGNNVTITPGDSTPSSADGTLIGVTAAGNRTPLTFTYKLAQSGAGALAFPQNPVVDLSNNSGNFSASDITVDGSGTFATFTVTYTPTTAGTQTAIVHVHTNDPVTGDYAFTVGGTYTPSVVPQLVVGGNGTVIANNDLFPSIADFTDFGPTSITFNAAIGRVSRTFNVVNTGDVNLVLSGAPLIKITGANAADFVLTATSASVIPGRAQSGFTITFTPHAVGLRKATVTLLSNDPLAPKFTFNIQATALKTTNAANGLQVATMVAGAGPAAVNGAAITVNYTGYLLNSKFESSLDPGGSSFTLVLGQTQVITGWTQGLVGMKAGETRLLVMPQALGYNTSSHGNVPANSALIFTITASAVHNPLVAISGNDIPIAYNDNTPSLADGTFIGFTPAGSRAPLTFTFKLFPGNDASINFPLNPIVVVANKSGSNFTTNALSIDSSGAFAVFTITYTPAKVGVQTAVVHIRTTDPLHPDFIFTVAGSYTPFIDFNAVGVGAIKFPAGGTIVSGAPTKYTIPVIVSNLGNVNVPGNTPATNFNIYLHNLVTNTNTLISSQNSTALRGTAPGKSKTVGLSVAVPGSIVSGIYQFIVKVNENGLDVETNAGNNTAVSGQGFNLVQGFNNVTGVISASTFPLAIVAGGTLNGKLTTLVRNSGNLTLAANQKFFLQTIAHDVNTNADFVIGTSTISLASWAPGKSALFAVTSKVLGTLPAGSYEIRALLSPVPLLTESSTADNLVVANGAGAHVALTVV